MKTGNLQELAALKDAMQVAQREREARAAQARERAARERHEQNLFAATVGHVAPLRKPPSPILPLPRPAPIPRQRQRDEAAVLVELLSDEFDVESLLETDETLSFRRPGISPDVVRKLRRGVWVLQAQLDLHGFRRDEARARLVEFLRDATQRRLRCVRIIHGKGNGSPGREPVLKTRVRSWLVQRSEVLAYTQARASEGGQGALVVLLRPVEARRVAAPTRR